MHASWKLMSLRESVWKHITLLRRSSTRWVIKKPCALIYPPCPKQWNFRMQRQQWTRNGTSLKSCQLGQWPKRRAKGKFFWTHKKERRTVHFATLMDMCLLKKAELEPKYQKYKGQVVLRGDIVKDDSGSYALFTEQGSCASQMTAARVMDVIVRIPDCAGQTLQSC